jgi:hypothetical protein
MLSPLVFQAYIVFWGKSEASPSGDPLNDLGTNTQVYFLRQVFSSTYFEDPNFSRTKLFLIVI